MAALEDSMKTMHSQACVQQSRLTPRTSWEKLEGAKILAQGSQINGVFAITHCVIILSKSGETQF